MFLMNLIELVKSCLFFTTSYSNNVFKEPLTGVEEEIAIKKCLEGDKYYRDKLIEHNLRLVAHIVKKYDYNKGDVDDLISIGTIGLIKGIDSYKEEHKTKITTYCARCIENEILMHFRSDKKNNKNVSLNEVVGFDKDGNDISFIDILKPEKTDFLEDLHLKNNIEILKNYLSVLNDREKTIIEYRYGLNNQKELTQIEVSNILNISRSYVSRIEKRAITKLLREFIKNKDHQFDE